MPLNKQQYLRLLITKRRGIIKIHGNSCSLQDVYVYLSVCTCFFQTASRFFFFLVQKLLEYGEIFAFAEDFGAIY